MYGAEVWFGRTENCRSFFECSVNPKFGATGWRFEAKTLATFCEREGWAALKVFSGLRLSSAVIGPASQGNLFSLPHSWQSGFCPVPSSRCTIFLPSVHRELS